MTTFDQAISDALTRSTRRSIRRKYRGKYPRRIATLSKSAWSLWLIITNDHTHYRLTTQQMQFLFPGPEIPKLGTTMPNDTRVFLAYRSVNQAHREDRIMQTHTNLAEYAQYKPRERLEDDASQLDAITMMLARIGHTDFSGR